MRIAVAVGGLLLVAQIVLLTIQLGTLRQSYAHIRAQDAKQSRLYPLQKQTAHRAIPVLEQSDDLIDQAEPALKGVRRLAITLLNGDLVGTLEQVADDVHNSRAMLAQSLDLQHQSLDAQR